MTGLVKEGDIWISTILDDNKSTEIGSESIVIAKWQNNCRCMNMVENIYLKIKKGGHFINLPVFLEELG